MEERMKFQRKKLNEKDNEFITKAANIVRNGLGLLTVCAVVGTGIKKYGKQITEFGKNIISKK